MLTDDMAQAIAPFVRIATKAHNILDPLDQEMRIMQWPPEHQVIMWQAVLRVVAGKIAALEPTEPSHD